MPKEETKRERFKRIAESRTNKIINMMELLGNCSNTHNYEYTSDDAKKIIKAIENELQLLKNKFDVNNQKNKEFKL
ncbi:hypothetical protein [Bacillus mycoides]|uniref:Uncharacterized protein n=1 Tax=Bacillus mycoides TaxID=1405 RepID=A0A1W6A565_BACMY|nr:hypothetical protein [Bacillus mycoides]ARJ21002.1 hypothetical protein B7492_07040 [Bacillus mycoides]